METRHYLWIAVGALGFAAGLAIPGVKGGGPLASAQAAAVPAAAKSTRGAAEGDKATAPKKLPPLAALPPSTDTIESLLALKDTEQYTRTGLWLLDATADQTAELWKAYHERSGGETEVWMKDLIFTQWAKKDPQGLLAAAKRDGEEGPAWWAWAMSDPDRALAEVAGQGESARTYALRGLSCFHPEKALKMLKADPSLAGQLDMEQLAEKVGRGDPQAGIEFLEKHGSTDGMDALLRKWVADNPQRAFDWLSDGKKSEDIRKTFLDAVAVEHPEALAELASGLPSGALKRELEAAAFQYLAQSDPDKALEEARKMESPLLAAQRLAQVGKELMNEHPERALDTLGELMEKYGDAQYRVSRISYPDGGSSSRSGESQANELLSSLSAWNPQQTMERLLEIETAHEESGDAASNNGNSSDRAAYLWLERDMSSYTTWLEGQNPATRDHGTSTVISYLQGQNNYAAAADWSLKLSNPNFQANQLGGALSNWVQSDREAALKWFGQAQLSTQQREAVQSQYPQIFQPAPELLPEP